MPSGTPTPTPIAIAVGDLLLVFSFVAGGNWPPEEGEEGEGEPDESNVFVDVATGTARTVSALAKVQFTK